MPLEAEESYGTIKSEGEKVHFCAISEYCTVGVL